MARYVKIGQQYQYRAKWLDMQPTPYHLEDSLFQKGFRKIKLSRVIKPGQLDILGI
jgi:hypothetical protein